VVLSSGAYTSSAATLTAGSASITIAADALATGSDTLTAKYTPDSASSAAYNSASGNGSVTVTQAASYLTAPANGVTVSPLNIQFTWTAVPGVISYSLWIGTTAGAQDAFYYTTAHLPNPAGTTNANTTLLSSTTYYATLGTLTSTGITYTTSIFTTSDPSYLTAPANGATVSPQNVQFSWTAVPGVINYTLWLGSTPATHDVLWYSTASTSNPTGTTSINANLTNANILPSTTYYATLWTLTSAGSTRTASTFQTSATS
jgi:hypothetical protein